MSAPAFTTEKTSESVKIPHVVGLYRNTRTGNYYGEKSLGTTDRKIAERRIMV